MMEITLCSVLAKVSRKGTAPLTTWLEKDANFPNQIKNQEKTINRNQKIPLRDLYTSGSVLVQLTKRESIYSKCQAKGQPGRGGFFTHSHPLCLIIRPSP